MKRENPSNFEHREGIAESSSYGISVDNLPEIFKILRKGIYSNPIAAVIREYSTNAWDAHVEAGKNDPIHVTLPCQDDPYFRVEDFGAGLTKDEVFKVYTQYGLSSKSNSNQYNGMLGIGCKSAFAYSEVFQIRSRKNGKESLYSAFIGKFEIGEICLLNETDCDANLTGVEISIPVVSQDFLDFRNISLNIYKFFSVKPRIFIRNNLNPVGQQLPECPKGFYQTISVKIPNLINGIPQTIDFSEIDDEYEKSPDNFSVLDISFYINFTSIDRFAESKDNTFCVVRNNPDSDFIVSMGNVGYSCDFYDSSSLKNIVLELPIGSVNFASSRETLQRDPKNINLISYCCKYISKFYVDYIKKDLQGTKTSLDFYSKCLFYLTILSPYNSIVSKLGNVKKEIFQQEWLFRLEIENYLSINRDDSWKISDYSTCEFNFINGRDILESYRTNQVIHSKRNCFFANDAALSSLSFAKNKKRFPLPKLDFFSYEFLVMACGKDVVDRLLNDKFFDSRFDVSVKELLVLDDAAIKNFDASVAAHSSKSGKISKICYTNLFKIIDRLNIYWDSDSDKKTFLKNVKKSVVKYFDWLGENSQMFEFLKTSECKVVYYKPVENNSKPRLMKLDGIYQYSKSFFYKFAINPPNYSCSLFNIVNDLRQSPKNINLHFKEIFHNYGFCFFDSDKKVSSLNEINDFEFLSGRISKDKALEDVNTTIIVVNKKSKYFKHLEGKISDNNRLDIFIIDKFLKSVSELVSESNIALLFRNVIERNMESIRQIRYAYDSVKKVLSDRELSILNSCLLKEDCSKYYSLFTKFSFLSEFKKDILLLDIYKKLDDKIKKFVDVVFDYFEYLLNNNDSEKSFFDFVKSKGKNKIVDLYGKKYLEYKSTLSKIDGFKIKTLSEYIKISLNSHLEMIENRDNDVEMIGLEDGGFDIQTTLQECGEFEQKTLDNDLVSC